VSAAGRSSAVAELRRPATIRERCANILSTGLADGLTHFRIAPDRLADVAELVAAVTRRRYPALAIPYHSRWRHLDAGGVDRTRALQDALRDLPADEQVRAKIDLIVVSVLLDAGAGETWRFRETGTGQTFARSEGLAVASVRMFEAGVFSSEPSRALRADAAALMGLDDAAMVRGFQASDANPLPGLDGRTQLLRRLGRAMKGAPDLFGVDGPRIGNLFDALRRRASGDRLEAPAILEVVLDALQDIWPPRLELDGANLGDTWRHPAAGGSGAAAGLVPLHKLSQWLTYSLVEPLEAAGMTISGLDALTGLAEYRNGGLFVDVGVLVPRHRDVTSATHAPESEVVVEWRALTVALLDRLAPLVAVRLGLAERELPLIKVLEGGTWAAGRELANERRGGAPPIRVVTDGTLF
jgi:Protein of unknown function (DUF1688)